MFRFLWLFSFVVAANCGTLPAQPPGPRGGGPAGRGSGEGASVWKALAEKHDADKDGQITAAEYTRGEEKFQSLDRNEDGLLSEVDFTGNFRRAGGGTPVGQPPQAGEVAPDFELPYAKDSTKTVKLSSFAGKRPVALVFGSYT